MDLLRSDKFIEAFAQAMADKNKGKGSYIIRFTAGSLKGEYYGTRCNTVKTRKKALSTICKTVEEWKEVLKFSGWANVPFEIICIKKPTKKVAKTLFQVIDETGVMFENSCAETVTQELVLWFEDNALYSIEKCQKHINEIESLDINALVAKSFRNNNSVIFTVCGISLIRTEEV